jgi:hypothetical protein
MDKATIIARLVQNKANADQYSAFSEDNHSAIDAMIETVERGYTEDEVYRKFNTPYSQDAALSIIAVLNGEEEFEDVLFPERE